MKNYSAKLSVMSAVVRSKNRSADQRTDYGKIGFDRQAKICVKPKHSNHGRWRMLDLEYFRELLCAESGDA